MKAVFRFAGRQLFRCMPDLPHFQCSKKVLIFCFPPTGGMKNCVHFLFPLTGGMKNRVRFLFPLTGGMKNCVRLLVSQAGGGLTSLG
jgi:hypothetical protein